MTPTKRQLLLLRHAKAMAAAHGAPDDWDHARPLEEHGVADAEALGRTLQRRGLQPEQALVSTAERARQTYAGLALDPPAGSTTALFSDRLYLADPGSLLDALHEIPEDVGSVLLVGHNPGLHELAFRLSGEAEMLQRGYPTCMLALFRVDAAWPDLAPRHASLLELITP